MPYPITNSKSSKYERKVQDSCCTNKTTKLMTRKGDVLCHNKIAKLIEFNSEYMKVLKLLNKVLR